MFKEYTRISIKSATTNCISGILFFLIMNPFTQIVGQSYLAFKKDPSVKVSPITELRAYPFPLNDVRLLKSPFLHAMQLDSGYILSLKPNRLLYRFYQNAGLPLKDSIY